MLRKLLLLSLIGLLSFSCAGKKPKKNLPAQERLEHAIKKFEKNDYLDAKTEFRIIVLNFPGHNIVDRAQYYLAECHFKMKEYILAIAEYEKLVRMFPNSEYLDDSMYKIGLCNFKLSPKYSLDQEFTLKAIEELQKFAEDFPDSDLLPEANELIGKCREKLAKKEYKNGDLYRKMSYFDAAILYFESVLNTYYDTKFAEDAQYWLAECLKRDRQLERAKVEFNRYLDRYPKNNRKLGIQKSLRFIENELNKAPAENSTTVEEKSNLSTNPQF